MIHNSFIVGMRNKHSSTVPDSQSGDIICPDCGIVVDNDNVPEYPRQRDLFSPNQVRERRR